MYVLMDIEWVENAQRRPYPTQIAAMRVNEKWEKLQLMSWRIQPPDSSFYLWDHVGYTGGYANEFLSAPPAQAVFKMLKDFLMPEDVLCWWRRESMELFCAFAPQIDLPQRELRAYLQKYLRYCPALVGNAYKVVERMGVSAPGISHHAKSDVKTMGAALAAIAFPQSLLQNDRSEELALAEDACFQAPYFIDETSKVVHKRSCAKIPDGAECTAVPSLSRFKKRDLRFCDCCSREYMQQRRAKNKKTIENSEYNFVYTPTSNLFHKRSCMLILNAEDVRGSVYYKSCLAQGRVPCQTCKPTQKDQLIPRLSQRKKDPPPVVIPPKPTPKKPPENTLWRKMTTLEKRALKRLRQAQSEREKALQNSALTAQQKEDMMILTQTRFGFWAAAGYQNFHLRHCEKLKGLSDLRGFAHYADAVRAGHQPCRYCRPTKKDDLEISMPIYSKERPGETVASLKNCCKQQNFQLTVKKEHLLLETPRGLWRIHAEKKPYTLEHINKIYLPDDRDHFHNQPRIFLSLTDIYRYIKKHDQSPQQREETLWDE